MVLMLLSLVLKSSKYLLCLKICGSFLFDAYIYNHEGFIRRVKISNIVASDMQPTVLYYKNCIS